jgi:hypothetical protein
MKFLLNLKMFVACLVAGLTIAFANNLPSASDRSRVSVSGMSVKEGKESVMEFSGEPQNDLQPNSKFTPEQVIKIQLDALRRNDQPTPDSGIRIAFRFASPTNREATGPIERFIPLVKSPLYIPLLNHRRAVQGKLRMDGNAAQQSVTITDRNGRTAIYLFTLSKQREAPYADCWMTDGVERRTDEEERNNRQIAQGNGYLPRVQ